MRFWWVPPSWGLGLVGLGFGGVWVLFVNSIVCLFLCLFFVFELFFVGIACVSCACWVWGVWVFSDGFVRRV